MKQRLLIICTRICAQTASNDDEYQHIWKGSNNHFFIEKPEATDDIILVVRGCFIADKLNEGKIDEAYAAFIEHIRKAIASFERYEKKIVIHKGTFPLGPQARYWKQFFSKITSQIRDDLSLLSLGEYSHVGGAIYHELPKMKERWNAQLFDQIWGGLFAGSRLEAYFDAILNLAMDNQSAAAAAIEKHESDIKESASDSEWREWQVINKRIHEWDETQSETNVVDLNDLLFQFAEKELIDRYSYFSETE